MKRPLIILTGPTAVGKSKLSISLAKAVSGEIISADSMQVYKNMDIGSAKITPDQMEGIPHYLIDELEPDEEFHVVKFQELARKYLSEIYNKGKIPVVVGGTGFYIQALLYDIDFTASRKMEDFRNEMEQLAKAEGTEVLHERLRKVDPDAAQQIHPNNVKRVIRALEFYRETGKQISKHNEEERKKESPYNFIYFVLNDDRSVLYERIDARVDQMMKDGLLEEVKNLKDSGYTRDMVSMQGLGYKEILDCLNGEISLEEAIYRIKRDTRHFAKRQLTWFKREKDVTWINRNEFQNDDALILEFCLNKLQEKDIWRNRI